MLYYYCDYDGLEFGSNTFWNLLVREESSYNLHLVHSYKNSLICLIEFEEILSEKYLVKTYFVNSFTNSKTD